MPHVVVKLVSGKSEEQKSRLAARIAEDVVKELGSRVEAVSVGIEEFAPEDWAESVYRPEIDGKRETLYVKPGYNPLEK